MENELHERLEKLALEKSSQYEKMYPKYKVLFIEALRAAYLMDREIPIIRPVPPDVTILIK